MRTHLDSRPSGLCGIFYAFDPKGFLGGGPRDALGFYLYDVVLLQRRRTSVFLRRLYSARTNTTALRIKPVLRERDP